MPVAIRKRDWEDHVTPRSGLKYSYDDLDLVCSRAVVKGRENHFRGRSRIRCASMPECGRTSVFLQVDVEDSLRRIKTKVQNLEDQTTSNFVKDQSLMPKGHTGAIAHETAMHISDRDSKLPSDNVVDQDELQHSTVLNSQTHGEDHDDKELNKDKVSASQKLSLSEPPTAVLAQIEEASDLSNALKTKSNISFNNSVKVVCSEATSTKSETSVELLENTESIAKVTAGSQTLLPDHTSTANSIIDLTKHPPISDLQQKAADPQNITQGRCCETCSTSGKVKCPNTNYAAVNLPSTLQVTDEHRLDANKETLENKHDKIQAIQDSDPQKDYEMLKDDGFNQPADETSLIESHGKFDTMEMWHDCSSKLHTIHEGSGDDASAHILAEMPEHQTCFDLRSHGNDEHLKNESPNINPSKDPESSLVKLRARKTSREEREKERSRMDSMVLLIMKLDQLDQEIEIALSSTSSLNGTPNLKRGIISGVDLEMWDSTGSLSASSQPLNTPIYRSSSSMSSSGPSGNSGARPKNEGSGVFSEKDRAEIEAKEACTWLRAAGFPQYAQLYEDGQFPIEIPSVTRDHDFLDQDAIEALCRRLNTLNKCALMRLEITPQRKRSEDSDEDEPCAISGRWTFQRDSKRWSRLDQLELDVFSPPAGETVSFAPFRSQDERFARGPLLKQGVNASSESVLTDLSEQPDVGSLHSAGSGDQGGSLSTTVPSSPAVTISNAVTDTTTRASSVASVCSSGTSGPNEDSISDGLPSPLDRGTFAFEVKHSSKSTGAEKSTRSRAKSFIKRMESLRLRTSSNASSKRKKKGAAGQGKLEISGPVIKEGLDEEKLRHLNCVDIATLDCNANRTRSISYSTQTSSGSTGSSQSEASSGSAVSTPSPVSRARSHSSAAGSTKEAECTWKALTH